MSRPLRAISVLVAVLALSSACDLHAHRSATAPAGATHTVTPADPARAAGGGDGVAPTAASNGAADDAFCALAKAKGAQDIAGLAVSSDDVDTTTMLTNLDDITAAAPADIKPDFTRLDTLEHAIFGATPDPQALEEAQGPDLKASLQRISDYLTRHCDIGA